MNLKLLLLSVLLVLSANSYGEELAMCSADVQPIERVSPQYPHHALCDGNVLFQLTVSESGTPQDIEILESACKIFDKPVLSVASKWVFPAQMKPCIYKTRLKFLLAE